MRAFATLSFPALVWSFVFRVRVQFCRSHASPFVHSTLSCIIYLQYLSHIVWYSNSILISFLCLLDACVYLHGQGVCISCAVHFFYFFSFTILYIIWAHIHIRSGVHVRKRKKRKKNSREEKASMMKDTKGNNTISNLAESQRKRRSKKKRRSSTHWKW